MTRLSVNINKYALLRNSRGTNLPDILQIARDCERFGAEGITIHPRQDERHIKYSDISPLSEVVKTELNIEGYADERFLQKVLEIRPQQCTLVPDVSNQLTSDRGWNTVREKGFLTDIVGRLKEATIRVALFVDANEESVFGAKEIGADRIEIYTGIFAREFLEDPTKAEQAIKPHLRAAKAAGDLHLGINAGHDLNLQNLRLYKERIENLLEVSIGHALICDAIYLGLEKTIKKYQQQLR